MKLSAVLFQLACSAESTAPPPTDGGTMDVVDPSGVCSGFLVPPDNCGGVRVSYTAVCNTARRPTREVLAPCQCGFADSWPCRYVRDPDAGLQRNVIHCGDLVAAPGVRLRFRAPVEGLPVGRVLVMGPDFTVEEVSDYYPFDTTGVRLTTVRAPVAGALTVTIQGPPRHVSQVPRMEPTMPTLRIVGLLCAAPITARLSAITAQDDP